MTNPRILESNGQYQTRLHCDDGEGSAGFAIETIENVAPVIERNKQLSTSDGYSQTREWRRIASIPLVVQLQWKQQYGVEVWNRNHLTAVKRLLNDPDWRWLRSSSGRV